MQIKGDSVCNSRLATLFTDYTYLWIPTLDSLAQPFILPLNWSPMLIRCCLFCNLYFLLFVFFSRFTNVPFHLVCFLSCLIHFDPKDFFPAFTLDWHLQVKLPPKLLHVSQRSDVTHVVRLGLRFPWCCDSFWHWVRNICEYFFALKGCFVCGSQRRITHIHQSTVLKLCEQRKQSAQFYGYILESL